MKSTIRLRTILTILPAVVAIFAILGTISLYISRSGMTRLAMRSLTFKAELLKEYGDAQWSLLVAHGFSRDPAFIQAAKSALRSSAESLLRQDSEWFFALDLSGNLAMSVSKGHAPAQAPPDVVAWMRQGVTGAVLFGTGSDRRYGETFFFQPFGWYLVASDTADAIFAEVDRMTRILLWTLAASIAAAATLLAILARSIARPIMRVSDAIAAILESNDFSQSLRVESNDEIGVLTRYFNTLCGELNRSYGRISDIAVREARARLEIGERELETLVALGKVAEFRDQDTGSHIIRVGLFARLLGRLFYEDEEEWRLVYHAAPLHDLGKVGIPDAILLKRGPLEPEEFEFMKTHTTIGHAILKDSASPILAMGAAIALSHHERYDGSGYPQGLRAEAIPLCGRLLAVIDVFDALCSKRPYKEAWAPERAFDFIASRRGQHFDPAIADAFLGMKEKILEILARNQ
ncbi:MAG TPA: HD domain-containing phosphohydrolase [Rectinemataceae bacterium]|nr:HD domain-containing phosphohydrolase [Rectinemataceae bacterium]